MTYLLSVIIDGHWRPGIGDPTIIGWLITGLYIITTVLCGISAFRSDRISPIDQQNHHRIFWWILTVFMLLMAINKQLDLQSWLMLVGRKVARSHGWYSKRKIIKIYFSMGIAVFSIIITTWLICTFRKILKNYILAILGIILLLTFVVIRAGAFHLKIFTWDQEVYIHNILEISSIVCILTSASIDIFRNKNKPTITTFSDKNEDESNKSSLNSVN